MNWWTNIVTLTLFKTKRLRTNWKVCVWGTSPVQIQTPCLTPVATGGRCSQAPPDAGVKLRIKPVQCPPPHRKRSPLWLKLKIFRSSLVFSHRHVTSLDPHSRALVRVLRSTSRPLPPARSPADILCKWAGAGSSWGARRAARGWSGWSSAGSSGSPAGGFSPGDAVRTRLTADQWIPVSDEAGEGEFAPCQCVSSSFIKVSPTHTCFDCTHTRTRSVPFYRRLE